MNTTEKRIAKVYPGLSARERVLLLLEDRKQGRAGDPLLFSTMPGNQQWEFDRIWRDVGVVNHELGGYILALNTAARQQAYALAWFETEALRAEELAVLRDYLEVCVKEPVTRSELTARKVNAGKLGMPLDVWPDADADEVETLRALRRKMEDVVGDGCRLRPPVDLDADPHDETLAGRAPRVLKGLRDAVVAIAGQAYATGQILDGFQGELDGADPLRPQARALLEETQAIIAQLLERLAYWIGPVQAPGDVTECVAALRRIVEIVRART